jgi:hypothetical protein
MLQDSRIAGATLELLEHWNDMGGILLYGGGAETSCFLMARERGHQDGDIWPATIYPSGKFEVVFQYLSSRAPFDDVELRDQLRQRLNQLPGVDIAAAKLALRPGFPLKALTIAGNVAALVEHLRWFYEQAQVAENEGSMTA